MGKPLASETILRVVSKGMIPFILLFGAYTQVHGDLGPGGGFQAGVIVSAGLILYSLIFGVEALNRAFPPRAREILMALGVLIYGGTGLVTLLLGGDYLDYDVLTDNAQHAQEIGLFSIELGVGITVATVMVTLFAAFSGRESVQAPEDAP